MNAPPIILDEAAVAECLSGIDVRGELRAMFAGLARGSAVQPAQTVTLLPAGMGDFITYLGVLTERGVFGAKLSPYFVQDGAAVVTAWTLLMSVATGTPLLLCDSKRLTAERTAGTTALAVELLAPAQAQSLAVVGAGQLGLAHLRHVASVRRWTSVALASPGVAGRSDLPTVLEGGCPIRLDDDVARAVAEADVVLLCTSSGTPVIDVASIRSGALVTSISTNALDAHEVEPAALAEMNVYCDYAATAPLAAGEMRLAIARGLWSVDALRGDLPGLIADTAPLPMPGRRTFFRSIGLGLEDIALADAVRRAMTKGDHA